MLRCNMPARNAAWTGEAPAFRLHPAGGTAADGQHAAGTGARTRRPCEPRAASLFPALMNDPRANDRSARDPAALAAAIRAGGRRALARAIPLMESSRAEHRRAAEAVLEAALLAPAPRAGASIRIGISGV